MSYLPAQENAANTYYQAGIAKAIKKLRPEDPEPAVSAIWIAILTFTFPALGGYLIRPEQGTPGGFADLYMVHFNISATPVREYHFFIVQCKRVSEESQSSTWNQARQQLRSYLPNLKPQNRDHPLYGAVAVGRWVELYRYNGNAAAGQEPLQPFSQTNRLHVARQCSTVQSALNTIRANHI